MIYSFLCSIIIAVLQCKNLCRSLGLQICIVSTCIQMCNSISVAMQHPFCTCTLIKYCSYTHNVYAVHTHTHTHSPALVTSDANLEIAAKRIIWGKCLNSGQTCIAPDYVLCMRGQEQKLIDVCKKTVTEFFGEVRSIQCISPSPQNMHTHTDR